MFIVLLQGASRSPRKPTHENALAQDGGPGGIRPRARSFSARRLRRTAYSVFSEAMSMQKRYFTSDLSIRS